MHTMATRTTNETKKVCMLQEKMDLQSHRMAAASKYAAHAIANSLVTRIRGTGPLLPLDTQLSSTQLRDLLILCCLAPFCPILFF